MIEDPMDPTEDRPGPVLRAAHPGARARSQQTSNSVPSRARAALSAFSLLLLAAGVLAAAACRGGGRGSADGTGAPDRGPPTSASVEWAGLRYEVSMLASPADRIRLRAEVTNVTAGYREVELPWCLIRARLHRDGRVVYDQARADGCGDGIRLIRLESGQSELFRRTLTADRVLGDSLSSGSFDVTVRLPRARNLGPPRAEMELRLGSVTLAREDGSG